MRVNNISGWIPIYNENVNVESKSKDSVIVRGLMLPKDMVSRNNVLYDWESQKQHVEKLPGKPFLYNHLNDGNLEPVGHFTDSACLEKTPDANSKWLDVWNKVKKANGKEVSGMYYEADLDPEDKYTRKIMRGDINKVSIQVMAAESRSEESDDGKSFTRAFISDILEGSAVPTPGFTQTNIEVALAEAFKAENQTTTTNDGASSTKLKEGDFGDFPMNAFHKGLETETSEHKEVDAMSAAQLVLDHLKEDKSYYNKESCNEDNIMTEEDKKKVAEEPEKVEAVEEPTQEEVTTSDDEPKKAEEAVEEDEEVKKESSDIEKLTQIASVLAERLEAVEDKLEESEEETEEESVDEDDVKAESDDADEDDVKAESDEEDVKKESPQLEQEKDPKVDKDGNPLDHADKANKAGSEDKITKNEGTEDPEKDSEEPKSEDADEVEEPKAEEDEEKETPVPPVAEKVSLKNLRSESTFKPVLKVKSIFG